MSSLKKAAICLGIMVTAQGALAAPFCVVTSYAIGTTTLVRANRQQQIVMGRVP